MAASVTEDSRSRSFLRHRKVGSRRGPAYVGFYDTTGKRDHSRCLYVLDGIVIPAALAAVGLIA